MSKPSNFEKAMENLATAIAKDAVETGKTLQDKCDALKVLTPYYAARDKSKAKKPDDEEGESSFADFGKAINGADDGTKVRSRRERTDA